MGRLFRGEECDRFVLRQIFKKIVCVRVATRDGENGRLGVGSKVAWGWGPAKRMVKGRAGRTESIAVNVILWHLRLRREGNLSWTVSCRWRGPKF